MIKRPLSNTCLLILLVTFAVSCQRSECRNLNAVFDKFAPQASEYKFELARQIQRIGTANLSYWFENYVVREGKEFMVIAIRGDELCARGEIEVNDWSKLAGMRKEVSGYRGAELRGLKIAIRQDVAETSFSYKDVDRIID